MPLDAPMNCPSSADAREGVKVDTEKNFENLKT